MLQWGIIGSLVIFGSAIGSFAAASVWRLRARELDGDKVGLNKREKAEYKLLKPLIQPAKSDRSRCLSCGHTLAWYDLLPLVSWVTLRGRCRYCRHTIGKTEFVAEVGLATLFVASYLFWPFALTGVFDWTLFGVWLVALGALAVLVIYDWKWSLLPDAINYFVIAIGVIFFVLKTYLYGEFSIVTGASLIGALSILSLLYYILHQYSRGKWVGFGDVILGVGLAFLLGDWLLAFFALFGANMLGLLFALPGVVRNRGELGRQIPFGPFLVAGTLLAFFLQSQISSFFYPFSL